MSKAWKGVVIGQVNHGDGRREFTLMAGEDAPRYLVRDGPRTVLIQPIDDESLPHPGDGRVWETKAGRLVEIEDVARGGWVRGRIEPEGYPSLIRAGSLRERKPEPEHKEWCHKGNDYLVRDPCTCERRSGEDRRQRERRSDWPYHVAREDRRHAYGGDLVRAKRGGRSGEDRRSP